MIGKKVRLTKSMINWYFSDQAYDAYVYPHTGKVSESYDKMMETMLLMAMFNDEYPGTVVAQPNMSTYRVSFSNGYSACYEAKDLRTK